MNNLPPVSSHIVTSSSLTSPTSPSSDLHHRPSFTREMTDMYPPKAASLTQPNVPSVKDSDRPPTLWGLPLKYVSLVTLALQNALLTIVMHYSRVSTPPDQKYSAAAAVLLNELLKGSISLLIAVSRADPSSSSKPGQPGALPWREMRQDSSWDEYALVRGSRLWVHRFRAVAREIFSSDCWKLSIPAILYVIQNNLQFVAASNLDVATFQVTYQMKILTTAGFSVLLLRKRLNTTKWFALFLLAVGVGIVQIQSGKAPHSSTQSNNPSTKPVLTGRDEMSPVKGFIAVTAACMTSGLAGVYFEMVLKGSQADLWVRNVQLSLFSLLPALVPVLFTNGTGSGFSFSIFHNFTLWAWATVLTQVLGGLLTAIVIKYADNIMKGFATSLSIIISFLAGMALFDFHLTLAFILGSSVVLGATYLYNAPSKETGVLGSSSADTDSPILGQLPPKKKHSPLTNTFVPLGSRSTSLASLSSLSQSDVGSFVNVERSYSSNPYGDDIRPNHTYGGGYTSSSAYTPPPSHPPSRPSSTRPTTT